MGLAEVSSTLWRERELLELLLFKLEEEQLLLASGRSRWLARATHEVEVVLGEIRRAELLRSVQVDEAAIEMGLPPNPSLRVLAEATDEPWRTLLLDHRQAFLTATAEIQAMAHANRELITSGQRAARDALLSLSHGTETYTPRGAPATAGTYARIVDEAM
jgi:hypothetical protein